MINWLLTQKKAINLLVFIAIVTILMLIFFPQIVKIVEEAKDSNIKREMAKIPFIATETMILYGHFNKPDHKIYCGENNNSQIRVICNQLKANSPYPDQVKSFLSAQTFCIHAPLHNRKFWRVDHTGSMRYGLCN